MSLWKHLSVFLSISLTMVIGGQALAQMEPPPGTIVSPAHLGLATPSPYVGTMPGNPMMAGTPVIPVNYHAPPMFPPGMTPRVNAVPPIVDGAATQSVWDSGTDYGTGPLIDDSISVVSSAASEALKESPAKRVVWFSAVEATYLRPQMDRPNSSSRVFNFAKSIDSNVQASDLEDFYAAPRITLNGCQFPLGARDFSKSRKKAR